MLNTCKMQLRTKELIKLLCRHGVRFIEHGANHDKYYSPITGKIFVIPRHAKEIPTGTMKSILDAAGVRRNQ